MPTLDTVSIFGLGLLGGSLGMALRARGFARRVVGIARRDETLLQALELGAVDETTLDPIAGALDAELVVVAVPVLSIPPLVESLREGLCAGAVVTDVGSTKAYLQSAIPPLLPAGVEYVGGHPMAGSEQAGLDAARADLFEGVRWVLTRPPGTSDAALDRVGALARAAGARVLEMDTAAHDEAVARISHLPHVAAAVLARAAGAGAALPETLSVLAAGGFRDTTRVAESPAEMWRDVCLTNRAALLAALADLQADLSAFAGAIERGDGEALEVLFAGGRRGRRKILGLG